MVCPRFEFQLRHGFDRLRFFAAKLFQADLGFIPRICHDRFLQNPFQLLSCHTIRRCIIPIARPPLSNTHTHTSIIQWSIFEVRKMHYKWTFRSLSTNPCLCSCVKYLVYYADLHEFSEICAKSFNAGIESGRLSLMVLEL